MEHPLTSQRVHSAPDYLGAAFRRVEVLFEQMKRGAESDVNMRTLRQTWSRMERGLRAHMRAEERWLFRELEASHPKEVGEFRADHDRIRKMLHDVGILVDRRFASSEHVQALLALLREHARREEESLHRWAVDELSETASKAMREQASYDEMLLAPLAAELH